MQINASYKKYIKTLRKNWHQRRIVRLRNRESQYKSRINSAIFLARYLIKLRQYRQDPINLYAILNILHDIFPSASVVGDKKPTYIFNLDRLAKVEGLNRLVIYRDCRDVVRSAMGKNQRDNWGKKNLLRQQKQRSVGLKRLKIWKKTFSKYILFDMKTLSQIQKPF